MTRAQSGRKQRWPFKTGVIARLATELYYRATNTHEIDGIITMEYHCVLFTVLLQLIIQPGRMSFFLSFIGPAYDLTMLSKFRGNSRKLFIQDV